MENTETSREVSGKSAAPRELAYLAFAAIPVLIYVLALAIFEQGNFGSMVLEVKLAAIMHSSRNASSQMVFSEGGARVIWLSSVLLYYILSAAVLVAGVMALKKSLTSKGFKLALVLWGVLSSAALWQFAYAASNDTALSAIYRFTFESLQQSHRFKPFELTVIKVMVTVVNVLAVVVPFVVALGASATLTPVVDADPVRYLRRLSGRARRLKTVVNLGSALLVAGILHMQAWLKWPTVFVDEAKLATAIIDWSLALTTFVGTVFSLMIAFLYISCASVLVKRAEEDVWRLHLDTIECPVEEWLEKHGFTSAPLKQLPQILAILAPLLAGHLGAAFSGLGNALGHQMLQ